MKITVFKEKTYSEKHIHSLTGKEYYQTMEYPPNHVDVDLVFDIIKEEKLKSRIDQARAYYIQTVLHMRRLKGNYLSVFLPEHSEDSVMMLLLLLQVL